MLLFGENKGASADTIMMLNFEAITLTNLNTQQNPTFSLFYQTSENFQLMAINALRTSQ